MLRRALLLPTLLSLATASIAQDQEDGRSPPIVVTGTPLSDYRAALEACIARRCPADEDAAASLRLAEAQFLGGEYDDARRTVRGSLRRNREQTAVFPEPLADLYRADARLSWHLGRDDDARQSTFATLNALQAGIPAEDHRHFTARLEIVEMHARANRFREARRELASLVQAATVAGRQDVAVMAELRSLWFDYVSDRRTQAQAELGRLAQSRDPAQRLRSTGAKILLARIYRSEGDAARADAMIRELGRSAAGPRRLIHAPRYEIPVQDVGRARDPNAPSPLDTMGIGLEQAVQQGNVLNRLPDNFEDKWIDVGFWVSPDGHVTDLEILREGSRAHWARPLLDSIRGRLYSTASEPTYRVERYTYTTDYEIPTGTRFEMRSPRARVEYLDLSETESPSGS